MATLSLDHVSKIYRPRGREPVHAVDQCHLAVDDGEIVALLGSSGCGKTSTLRMIAGFEDVSRAPSGWAPRDPQAAAGPSATSRWRSRAMRSIRR